MNEVKSSSLFQAGFEGAETVHRGCLGESKARSKPHTLSQNAVRFMASAIHIRIDAALRGEGSLEQAVWTLASNALHVFVRM